MSLNTTRINASKDTETHQYIYSSARWNALKGKYHMTNIHPNNQSLGKEESTRKREYKPLPENLDNHHLENNLKGRKNSGVKKKNIYIYKQIISVNLPRNEHHENMSTRLNALRGKHHMVKIHQNNQSPDTEKKIRGKGNILKDESPEEYFHNYRLEKKKKFGMNATKIFHQSAR